jgi:hypothetical protein
MDIAQTLPISVSPAPIAAESWAYGMGKFSQTPLKSSPLCAENSAPQLVSSDGQIGNERGSEPNKR